MSKRKVVEPRWIDVGRSPRRLVNLSSIIYAEEEQGMITLYLNGGSSLSFRGTIEKLLEGIDGKGSDSHGGTNGSK